ncbi:hypothetical protein KCP71_21075 [Salmonella enterica subsp. enterica]|nr:hypothetical protein KCP71_21075 [Salmonella enterica subsp. enterica]
MARLKDLAGSRGAFEPSSVPTAAKAARFNRTANPTVRKLAFYPERGSAVNPNRFVPEKRHRHRRLPVPSQRANSVFGYNEDYVVIRLISPARTAFRAHALNDNSNWSPRYDNKPLLQQRHQLIAHISGAS